MKQAEESLPRGGAGQVQANRGGPTTLEVGQGVERLAERGQHQHVGGGRFSGGHASPWGAPSW